MSIKSEILGIAREHGYTGNAQTITGAINALTDALAGEDVAGGKTVAAAISALAPYIGSGGGGGGGGEGGGYPGSFVLDVQKNSTKQAVQYIQAMDLGASPRPAAIINYFGAITKLNQTLILPSGLAYTIGLDSSSTVASVTLRKGSDSPQSLEYSTMSYQGALAVMVMVPEISAEEAYDASSGVNLYVMSIEVS